MTEQESQEDGEGLTAKELLHQLLSLARKRGASDLHVGASSPPIVRLNGSLFVLQRERLSPEDAKEILFSALTRSQRERAEKEMAVETLLARDDGRYRVCIIKQRLGWDGCFRIIPSRVPQPDQLGIPKAIQDLTTHRNGLILITGPRGSGKTTTLGSLVNLVNMNRAEHILTIEDPVEYVINSIRCIVSQRTVGLHTESFAAALRSALREDPDVIVVGDLRDTETISLAITAAETGHLVIGSLNTGSAIGAVARIVDAFPLEQQQQVLTMLSESLRGVASQRLIPLADGGGRVLALEVLINTPGIGSLIRDNRMHQIRSAIQTGKKRGMQLLDEDLGRMVKNGLVTREAAAEFAEHPERLPKGRK
ncbi:type IV pilus twitching motility protein PilT [Planctomycetota bacterium]